MQVLYVKKISDYKRDLGEIGKKIVTGLGLVHIITMKNCELGLSIAARLWATLCRLPVTVFHYMNVPAGKEKDVILYLSFD